MKRLMAAERKSQGNERHNVPVASLPSPPPLSPPLTPTLAVSLCAPGQVRSSGFLARSRDAPIDPRCCGFIKTFPPPSYCVCDCMFVCLSLSLYVSLSLCVIVCVCICHRVLLLFYNIRKIRKYSDCGMHCGIFTLHFWENAPSRSLLNQILACGFNCSNCINTRYVIYIYKNFCISIRLVAYNGYLFNFIHFHPFMSVF